MKQQAQGLALEVNKNGKILRILYNNIGTEIDEKQLFPTILARAEFNNALSFMQRLQTEHMVSEIPLGLEIDGTVTSYYFSGVKKQENYVLIASSAQGMESSLYDEIAKVNNELANQLRSAIKTNLSTPTPNVPNFDEFSKLNNELINAQRELNKSNKKLEQLNEQKNEMIGIAAHDLRNPLSVITGYIQFVMGTGTNLTDAQRQMLDKSVNAAKKMMHMLEELLDMSEIESGRVILNKTQADLDKLLQDDVELNQVIANKKNITIDYQSQGPIDIEIDPPKIEQVFNNFLSNAIKYSQPNTCIKVRVERTPKLVTVKVIDQGPGIPDEEVNKVFKPFETTSVQATDGEKSTGLGLSICSRIINVHGGQVGLQSKVGKGSEFYFSLPLWCTTIDAN